uniref:uncharacterized protein LOC120336283 n=1 Tax=Styela clava TaxID=7725 RepID=UPI0019396B5F|nr:uncharacterized protein LOC120336283 [Styela clava]
MQRPDTTCYGEIQIGVYSGFNPPLCENDEPKRCHVYRKTGNARCQNTTPDSMNCSHFRSHKVQQLPEKITLLVGNLDLAGMEKWFDLHYRFVRCKRTTPVPTTPTLEIETSATSITEKNEANTYLPKSGVSLKPTANTSVPVLTSTLSNKAVGGEITNSQNKPISDNTKNIAGSYLPFIIAIAILSIILILSCIAICVGYFRYVRTKSVTSTSDAQNGEIDNPEDGINVYSEVKLNENLAKEVNPPELVQNVLYESY